MGRRSYLDRAEFCDVNGEYSGSISTNSSWIDALAEKSEVRNIGDGIEESVEGFGWLVGNMRGSDSEANY